MKDIFFMIFIRTWSSWSRKIEVLSLKYMWTEKVHMNPPKNRKSLRTVHHRSQLIWSINHNFQLKRKGIIFLDVDGWSSTSQNTLSFIHKWMHFSLIVHPTMNLVNARWEWVIEVNFPLIPNQGNLFAILKNDHYHSRKCALSQWVVSSWVG